MPDAREAHGRSTGLRTRPGKTTTHDDNPVSMQAGGVIEQEDHGHEILRDRGNSAHFGYFSAIAREKCTRADRKNFNPVRATI